MTPATDRPLDSQTNQLVSDLWSSVGSLTRAADEIASCRLDDATQLENARQLIAYALTRAARVSSLVDFRITALYEEGSDTPS